MTDPAFENAGTEPGILIWRIENFTVVPYPKEKYGQFHQGDAFIVLYTTVNDDGVFKWDIHFWLGSQVSQDEAGSAAIKSVELDDQLGGSPVQYREVEGHESSLFVSRFEKGVRYLKGGVASGFRHVDPDAPYPCRLFKVKGKRDVRCTEVEVSFGAMNKFDSFILDAGKTVFAYFGPSSRNAERMKGIMVANSIRDDDHAGDSKVIIVDESADGGDISAFVEAMGSGSIEDIPDTEEEDDLEHEKNAEKEVTLHRIWEEDDLIKNELVSGAPLTQNMLAPGQDCFLLDTGGSGIFVWIGRESSKKEKIRSMDMAQKYLVAKNYPSWSRVQRVVQNAETTNFQEYFTDWQE